MTAPEHFASMTAGARALWQRVVDLWAMAARRDDAAIRRALHPDCAGWDMNTPAPYDRRRSPGRVSARRCHAPRS
jgi:hypothetical protein